MIDQMKVAGRRLEADVLIGLVRHKVTISTENPEIAAAYQGLSDAVEKIAYDSIQEAIKTK